MLSIVCRATNRLYVGLPLCAYLVPCPQTSISSLNTYVRPRPRISRNPTKSYSPFLFRWKFSGLDSIHFPAVRGTAYSYCDLISDTNINGNIYRFVGRLLSRFTSSIETLKKSLGVLVQERLEKEKNLGQNWNGRPVSPSIPSRQHVNSVPT